MIDSSAAPYQGTGRPWGVSSFTSLSRITEKCHFYGKWLITGSFTPLLGSKVLYIHFYDNSMNLLLVYGSGFVYLIGEF